jgi:tRNA nucleotidyltransferase/poly(A) polymerase/lipopolysaccharide/colanic/teichoic acid biosynthesis glycosyltransferase
MRLCKWERLPNELQTEEIRPYYDALKKKAVALFFKRCFDVFVSAAMLLILSPIFLILAIAIKIDSKGPVFYRQVRVTQYGKQFRIFKFRTMVQNADKIGAQVTVNRDPRITRVGNVIRKCRLDELCQLIDVFRGTMTFVGTRPEVPKYVASYTSEMMATLLLPAGITSEASIYYKDENELLDAADDVEKTYTEVGLPDKMKYNLAAINSFTVLYLTLAAWCMTNQCSLKRVREIPHMKLPEEVMYCIETLSGAGYSVYAVGGCVRDHLMGLTPSDFDLCTSATPEQICELFERHQLVRSGEKHGTIGVVVAGELYEITTFRTEGEYSDTRHPDWVEFVTDVRQDLARRDFTVNAIAYNPQIGFVDPFGGMQDLEKKVLRAVGEPEKRFREDALRILRGVRFSVRFALTPEEKTLAAMNSCAPLMENLARERGCTEICKLLPLINTNQLLCYKTILTQVFPELTPEEGEDLYPQVAALADQLPAVLELRMAALLHRLDEETVTRILTDLRASNALRSRVTLLVRLQTPALPADKKQLLPLLGEYGQEAIEQLAALQLAIARQAQADTANLVLTQLALQAIRQDGSCLTVKDLSIKGSDLLELGVEPGPRIGQCMQFLLSLVQDEIIANEKEVLLESAKDFLAAEEE